MQPRQHMLKNLAYQGKSKENQSEFLITQTSKSGEGVPVTVTVTDQAGNKTEKTQKLFIDSLAPTVSLTGAADYLITSQPVTLNNFVHFPAPSICAASITSPGID